ncbi:MAG: hypothetical protein K8R56_00870, partial [Candidatus Eisenbacteria bacterium]|nr:hypothetical protein [Candidatus Eisenbacteria bacterium]
GPNGSLGSGACIVLSEPGEYTIDYYDPATGNGDVCSRTLYATTCAPPPPPPTREQSGCPLTSREWSRTCGARGALVDPAAFAAVASAVDARSAVWSFTNASEGLCRVLRRGNHMSDRDLACRQYAALLANLSAGELQITASDGRQVGLDPAMLLDGVRGVPAGTTVATWVERTEAALLAQNGRPARSRDSRDEYRRITHQARAIMRMAPRCGTSVMEQLEDNDEPDVFGVSAPAPAAGTISTTHGHDPLTGARRMRWTLERASEVQLDIVDVTGRKVRHLAEGMYAAGTHDFAWDGRDDDGRTLRAGAYFVVGRVGGERTSARLFLLK